MFQQTTGSKGNQAISTSNYILLFMKEKESE
jgi:hypothetical protein